MTTQVTEPTQAQKCRCESCRRPLTHPISVAAQRGPVCRQRAGGGDDH